MSRSVTILSILIAVLATIASAGGLLLDNLYRDNVFVTTTWLGNDAITLFLAVPILVVAMILSNRKDPKGLQRTLGSAYLVWMGALDEELTAKSYIVPGLGDAGDLAFGEKLQE